ncbi:MAG TPA: hypothetical protein VFM63_12665 [Pyrinomonadaceae bacterium]|nr:hypothetical protein [Pyrinomonadaceae bacterium]
MKTFWLIVAAVFGVVTLYFAFKGNYENAFVTAALGGCAAFLNYRAQLKQKLKDDEEDS